jgi:hypothetical protein
LQYGEVEATGDRGSAVGFSVVRARCASRHDVVSSGGPRSAAGRSSDQGGRLPRVARRRATGELLPEPCSVRDRAARGRRVSRPADSHAADELLPEPGSAEGRRLSRAADADAEVRLSQEAAPPLTPGLHGRACAPVLAPTAEVGDLDSCRRQLGGDPVRCAAGAGGGRSGSVASRARCQPWRECRPRPFFLGAPITPRASLHYKRTGSLADVAELLGDSKRVAADHYVYALTDYREVDRSIAVARVRS